MDMLTTLQRSGGIDALSRQAGVAPAEALSAVKELLPAMLAAFRGYGTGTNDLLELLARYGDGSLAADVMSVDPVQPDRGRELLSELSFGGEAVGSRVTAILAMLIGGYISAVAAGHSAGGDSIEDLLAG